MKTWRYIALFVSLFLFVFFECYDADPHPPHWFTYYQDRAIETVLEALKVVGAVFLLVRIFSTPKPKNKTML